MSTPIVYDLDAWRAQALEALDASQGIQFQPRPGGEIFTAKHPLLLTDVESINLDRASGSVAIATVIIGGQEIYVRFVAAGGQASDVMMAWRIMQQGVALDPNLSAFTPSSAGVHASSRLTSNTVIQASLEPSISGGAQSFSAPAS